MALKVLALDLGTQTGFCYNLNQYTEHVWVEFAGTKTWATAKEITLFRKQRMDRRLDPRIWHFHKWLSHLLHENKFDIVVFEDVQFSSTVLACQLWASLRSVVWVNCEDTHTLTECVNVKTLKKWATGDGNATKETMAAFALKSGYELPTLDDNGIDAFWLWRWAHEKLKRYERTIPESSGPALGAAAAAICRPPTKGDPSGRSAATNRSHSGHRVTHRALAPRRER
jgi:Holliday junction resolvasome RuvABC endonuclease subunit